MMKDRRVIAFERVLSRRRQLDRKLNTELGALREASRELAGVLDARRSAVDVQMAELMRQDGKIDAMLNGTSFRADDLLALREYRSHSAGQHAMLEAQATEAERSLMAKDQEIGAQRTNILRNRARIDVYEKRRGALVKAIELAIEDAQDEEASENRRPAAR